MAKLLCRNVKVGKNHPSSFFCGNLKKLYDAIYVAQLNKVGDMPTNVGYLTPHETSPELTKSEMIKTVTMDSSSE
jgi:hypothetical protein